MRGAYAWQASNAYQVRCISCNTYSLGVCTGARPPDSCTGEYARGEQTRPVEPACGRSPVPPRWQLAGCYMFAYWH